MTTAEELPYLSKHTLLACSRSFNDLSHLSPIPPSFYWRSPFIIPPLYLTYTLLEILLSSVRPMWPNHFNICLYLFNHSTFLLLAFETHWKKLFDCVHQSASLGNRNCCSKIVIFLFDDIKFILLHIFYLIMKSRVLPNSENIPHERKSVFPHKTS